MDELARRLAELTPEQRERLSAHIRDGKRITSRRVIQPLRRDGRKFPLSSAQQRLWLLQQIEPGNPTYNLAGGLHLDGDLDEAALKASLLGLIARHETLRTRFADGEGGPWQIIEPEADLKFDRQDISRREMENLAAGEARTPFDLTQAPPVRARLLRLGTREHVLLLTLHHIVCDGWSLGVLLREWTELYSAARECRSPRLKPLPVQYADYAVWQQEWLKGPEPERQMKYWRERLAGVQPLDLPTDHPAPSQPTYRGGRVKVQVRAPLREKLELLSRRQGITLFTTLLGVFQLLLHRYSGQRDIAVGTPVAGRRSVDVEGLIGFFVNTLVLRTDFEGDPTVVELLKRVRETTLGAFTHQDLPFEQLVAELEPDRSLNRSPLFQVMLAYQNTPEGELSLEGLEWQPLAIEIGTAKYELTLGLGHASDGALEGALEHSRDLFDAETAGRIAQHWMNLLEAVVADPEARISRLKMLGDSERRQVIVEWNRTEVATVGPDNLPALWDRQVEKTPDRVAIESERGQITWRELDRLANGVARRLLARGIGLEGRVGVCVGRSERAVAGMLGVWKAGGAWVPLDPAYPGHPLNTLIGDAGLGLVLCDGPIPVSGTDVLDLNEVEAADDAPACAVDPDNSAYVIYTSGSTGRPKGVVGTHRAILNRFEWMWRTHPFSGDDVVAQKTALTFVDAIWEIFGPLLCGVRLAIIPDNVLIDPPELVPLLRRLQLTRIVLVPSLLRLLLDSDSFGQDALPALRHWTSSGEALPPQLVERLRERCGCANILNLYGSSEVAADSTCHEIGASELGCRVSAGKPIANTRLYILDCYGNPVPVSVRGELYIGGAGIARGYLDDPRMTALRFTPDPFSGRVGERLYRTGDLVRWLPNGEIEILGRSDSQVKIRGIRIELEEVRGCLETHPSVRKAVVVMRATTTGEPSLVAYVTPRAGASILPEALRRHVRERAPEYMTPAAVVVLERLPLTRSGKVDRAALPEPNTEQEREEEGYRSATEEIVAGIWAEVLGRERVGRQENFFELGGHSLVATQVMARVRKALGVELALRTLFETPTVAGLSRRVEQAGAAEPEPALERVPREGPLPASYGQQRLWFLQQMEPESAYYNCPGAVRLRGALDEAALERSLRAIVERHEVLRTRYQMQDGELRQVVGSAAEFVLERELLRGSLEEWLEAEARRPFDLGRDLPVRARLLRVSEQEWVLALTLHHIAADGWSMGVVVRELNAHYRGERLPELRLQYGDYVVWERGRRWERSLAYWKERLSGLGPALELAADHARPGVRSYAGGRERIELSEELSGRVGAVSRRYGASEYMTLLAALMVVLWRYSGQKDIAVGTALGGREREELEGLIGLFINTMVVRAEVEGSERFEELLGRVKEEVLEGQRHGGVPFERVVEAVAPERSLGHGPLVQVMFLYEGQTGGSVRLGEVESEGLEVETGTAKFDVTLGVSRVGGRLSAVWEYSRELWEAETARRMLESWVRVVEGAVGEPGRRLRELEWVGEAERRQVLEEWNRTEREIAGEGNVVWWVEREAETRPDGIAVEAEGGEQISYGELNRRANGLAKALRGMGIGQEERVGVCIERGVGMVVGLLGVLKAGGAYVPLEPGLPGARLRWMLGDTGARVVVVDEAGEAALGEWAGIRLRAEEEREEMNPGVRIDGEQLAYVIYTSGSTGQPKGVAVPHRAIVNRLRWMQNEYLLEAGEPVLHKTPFGFDVSVWELFWPLMTGARLVIAAPDGHKDPAYLASLIRRTEITTLHFVPSMLRAFVDSPPTDDLPSLRRVVSSGEALSSELVQCFYARFSATLYNLYGPTEAAVDVTHYRCNRSVAGSVVPIGRPIANLRIYILDSCLEPVATGVAGHLHIGGVGVARAYERKPELTGANFIPDPFSDSPGARMYRTGDLARWLPSGDIEYLGRLDHQVKIRGVRVEPGEIETVLTQHEGVKQAVVTMHDFGARDTRLAGYIVPANDRAPTDRALRDFLRERLPEHMVPAVFVTIPALPISPNGKLDRKRLPLLAIAEDEQAPYVAPRTSVEEVLAGIWTDLLGVARVGAGDSFFNLGGHSLLAVQTASRIQETFQVTLPLRLIFERPRLAALAEAIEASLRAGFPVPPPLERVSRSVRLPLSFSQQRLWFLQQLEPGGVSYNCAGALRLSGPLDCSALEQSFTHLVERHEILRTIFRENQHGAEQIVLPSLEFSLELLAARTGAQALEMAAEHAQHPFDLTEGPLIRAAVIRLAEHEHLLLLSIHHIVSDGWSLQLLFRELTAIYECVRCGKAPALPPLPVQYADYAVWQRQWMQGEALDHQLAYWKRQLEGAPDLSTVPADRPRPAVESLRGARRLVQIDPDLSRQIHALSRREGVTVFMTLIAAFQVLLCRYSGERDIVVGAPVAGRNRTEIEGLIGFFINTLALRCDLSGDPSFRHLLARVRETVLGAYAHQDIPFEHIVAELRPERTLSHAPLFQVMFDYLDTSVQASEILGLPTSPLDVDSGTAKFDLTLTLGDSPDGFRGSIEYATDLFDGETVDRLARHFEVLLAEIVRNPESALSELPLMDDEERGGILAFAGPGLESGGPLVPPMFEECVRAGPDRVALVEDDQQISYGELNRRANRLAHQLLANGVKPEMAVGIYLEKCADSVVAILAVVKSGAFYVPLDPAHTRAVQLQQQRLPVLITRTGLLSEVSNGRACLLCIDSEDLTEEHEDNPACRIEPDSLAYLIYTSGSTGEPKKVGVPHSALASAWRSWEQAYSLTSGVQRHLQMASPAFDVFTGDLVRALCSGGTLVLCQPEALVEPEELYGLLRRERIDCAEFVPAVLRELIALGKPLDSLAVLIAGSSVLEPADYERLLRAAGPRTRVFNSYGVTEATIDSTLFSGVAKTTVPIGRPIANTRVYMLDRWLNPVPVGVPGEIYLGGAGLARGYLGRPDLTAERWLPDPFSAQPGARLYRTGDLGRWTAGGDVEYLGRLDQQVKIRGFRIEPGEIEAALAKHPQIREAAVVVRDGRLVAYLAGESTAEQARHYLSERLPDYLVPGVIEMLPQLPRTANGKLDRRSLPEPGATRSAESRPPRNAVEATLARIWSQTLGREAIGLDDNFFQLGGDSILSIQIVSRARQAGLKLTVRQMFQHQTIGELAQVVEAAGAAEAEQGEVRGELELSPIQRWFFAQEFEEAHHWNQAVLLRMREDCERGRLEQAWRAVLRHHDGLRQRFTRTNGTWRGWQEGVGWEPDLEWVEVSSRAELESIAAAKQESLDLTRGPLVRAVGFELGPGERRLLIVAHHLVVDGVSWRILLEDLERGCRGEALPAKTTSWRSWAQRLRESERGRVEATPAISAEPWPVEEPGGAKREASAEVVRVSLAEEATRRLLEQGGIQGTLLAALAGALTRYSGARRVTVDVEGHGRDELEDVDVTRTVGWFTTVRPITLEVRAEEGLPERARRLEAEVRAKAGEALEPGAVSFNYLGQFEAGGNGGEYYLGWAEESSGPVHSSQAHCSYEWEINAAVRGGRLWMEWIYGGERYGRASVDRTAAEYLRELEELAYGEVESSYALTPMQQGMLFHMLWEPEGGLYYEQMGLELEGEIEPELWREAWQQVVNRHEALRTEVHWQGRERPVQVVKRQARVEVEVKDWSAWTEEAGEQRLEEELSAERRQGFDLERAPLQRLRLIRRGAKRWECIWSHPHLMLDGWAVPVVLEELLAIYGALRQRRQAVLPEPGRYRDYVAWLERQDSGKAESYWRGRLRGLEGAGPLPGERRGRAAEGASRRSQRVRELSEEATARLERAAQREQVTLNTLVQAAWSMVLSRHSGRREVVFGATVSGRPAELPAVERTVGLFLNTLPVRVRIEEQQGIGAWLRGLQAQEAEAREYEYASLAQVQAWSGVTPLFESLVVFENYPMGEGEGLSGEAGVRLKRVRSWERTNYALTLVAGPGRQLRLRMGYAEERFEGASIEKVLEQLERALLALTEGDRVGRIEVLGEGERARLLEFGRGEGAQEPEQSVVEMFEARVAAQPDAIAVVSQEEVWSYAALNGWANRVAWWLMEMGVGPESRVGLQLGRGAGMVAAVLGVLKAGGAYVPLEPGMPEQRLRYMREDAGVEVVVTDGDLECAGMPELNPPRRAKLDNLAYLIYTSGSTGQPKAVLITHANLARLFTVTRTQFQFEASDVWTLFHSYAFDFSVWEIWGALLFGARLVVVSHTVSRSPEEFLKLLATEQVTVLNQTPSAFGQLSLHEDRPGERASASLRVVIFGGEALDPTALETWFRRRLHNAPQFVNMYGITETTVHVTYLALTRDHTASPASVVGRPIGDLETYILDDSARLMPPGAAGEICVGGPGLSRGYWNRPDLTAERFIPNPFSAVPGERLYRSGDLGRMSPDGCIEHLGRTDHQIKIRGFRVELGEIEAGLRQHSGVRQALVMLRKSAQDDRRLVAYVLADGAQRPESRALRRFLEEKLPSYAIPAAFVVLDEYPLTINGKVNRAALPEPGSCDDVSPAPLTPVGQILASLWEEVLVTGAVRPNDNFFELGGHSLLVTRLIARVRSSLGIELPLRTLFDFPEFGRFVDVAERALQTDRPVFPPAIPRVAGNAELPLSLAQHGLWVQHRLNPASSVYHVRIALRLEGRLDVGILERSLGEIVRHHESLRARFGEHDGQPWQTISPVADAPLTLTLLHQLQDDVRQSEVGRILADESARPFDLTRDSLLRAALLRLAPDDHILCLTAHHIVIDGWSMAILYRDWMECYRSLAASGTHNLPELLYQYVDFAVWERELFTEAVLAWHMDYWRKQLAGMLPVAYLPQRSAEPLDSTGRTRTFVMPADLTTKLKTLSRQEGVTLFMALLAVFKVLLHRYSAQDDIAIGTAVANRNRADQENLVGLFLNMLVLRTDLSGNPRFRDVLARVREISLAAYSRQQLPFAKVAREIGGGGRLLPQIAFSFDTIAKPSFDIPGLRVSTVPFNSIETDFDLSVWMGDGPNGLETSWTWRAHRFAPETIAELWERYIALAESAVGEPGARIAALDMRGREERERLALEREQSKKTGLTRFQNVRERTRRQGA